MRMDDPHSVVLLVCTANICRSAMAQVVLADALAKADGGWSGSIVVTSAGVYAQEDAPIAPKSAALLTSRSLDSGEFRSKRLTPELVQRSELVLGAALEHRRAAVAMCPSAAAYAFTLLEFAWLLTDVPAAKVSGDTAPDRLRGLVALARGQRGLRMPERDLDLPDPYGHRTRAYRKTLDRIDEAVGVIVDRLVPARSVTGSVNG